MNGGSELECAVRAPSGSEQEARHVQDLQGELDLRNEELRRMQQQLAESRDRYGELFDLSPTVYLTVDREGRVREANLAAARLLDLDRRQLVGRPLSSFMDQGHADVFHLYLEAAFDAPNLKRRRELRLRIGAEDVFVLFESVVLSRRPDECRVVMIDRTPLRRTEGALEAASSTILETKGRLKLIVEHVEDLFVLIERGSDRVTYVSPAFFPIFGRNPSTFIREGGWPGWIHPQDAARVDAARRNYLVGDPFDLEYRIMRADDEERLVHVRAFPIEERGRRSDALVIRDVTAERRLEEDLQQAQKLEALGAFASTVAHDFNNVLQAIIGCVSVARAQTRSVLALDFLDKAARAARRGRELSTLVMGFTRKQPASPQTVAIDDVISEARPLIERLVGSRVDVDIRTGAAGCATIASAVQIEQVLLNLAANARDAMQQGGTLSIRTEPIDERRQVRLVVQDTGAGFDENTRRRIFEPFFTTKSRGTGMGLATVANVLEQLGGTITTRSQPGDGTTFSLYFPCSGSRARPSASAHQRRRGLVGRVLLVEDESTILLTTRLHLELLGLEVIGARSGAEALRLCGEDIQLLLCDLLLPDIHGVELVDRLRQRFPDVRALLVTGNPELVDEGYVEKIPVLQKPFTFDELTRQVEHLLRHPAP